MAKLYDLDEFLDILDNKDDLPVEKWEDIVKRYALISTASKEDMLRAISYRLTARQVNNDLRDYYNLQKNDVENDNKESEKDDEEAKENEEAKDDENIEEDESNEVDNDDVDSDMEEEFENADDFSEIDAMLEDV